MNEMLPPHAFLTWKLPVQVSDEIEMGAARMSLRVTVCEPLVVFTS